MKGKEWVLSNLKQQPSFLDRCIRPISLSLNPVMVSASPRFSLAEKIKKKGNKYNHGL